MNAVEPQIVPRTEQKGNIQVNARRHIVISSALILFFAICPSLLAGTFTNGGFEIPQIAPNSLRGLANGDFSVIGWTVGGNSGGTVLQNGFPIGAAEGSQYVVFNGGGWPSGGTIAQNFDTKAGHRYMVSFRVGKLGGGPGLMEITAIVTAGDGSVLTTSSGSQSTLGWGVTNSFLFTAKDVRSALTFLDTSESTTDTDVALDEVSVQPESPRVSIAVSYVDICWPSATNTLYQVQYRSEVAGDTWHNLGSPVLGNGATTCFTDSIKGQPRKFYRVQELP